MSEFANPGSDQLDVKNNLEMKHAGLQFACEVTPLPRGPPHPHSEMLDPLQTNCWRVFII